jgi:hypothetical protein
MPMYRHGRRHIILLVFHMRQSLLDIIAGFVVIHARKKKNIIELTVRIRQAHKASQSRATRRSTVQPPWRALSRMFPYTSLMLSAGHSIV